MTEFKISIKDDETIDVDFHGNIKDMVEAFETAMSGNNTIKAIVLASVDYYHENHKDD